MLYIKDLINSLPSNQYPGPRPNLFPTRNTLYSLPFPIFHLALHIHYTTCMNLPLNSFSSTPSQEPTFRLPNLKFSSVSVVPDCRLVIWQCSGLAPALLSTGPSSMNPPLLKWPNIKNAHVHILMFSIVC